MLLLDTTAVSDLMHRRSAALDRLRDVEPREVVVCAPVAAEIRFGLARLDSASRRRTLLEAELERLLELVSWADWDEPATRRFGVLKARLQAAGTPLDDMDLAIASIALSIGARLATANVRHFERVPGLELDRWT